MQYNLTVSAHFSDLSVNKINPKRETQAATDRVYKLRDTEETPQLLLLARLHCTAPGEPNIWVDKEADEPDSHQG